MEEQIEQIKNAIRELVQIATSRGEPLTDEIREALAQAIDHAANRIQEIRTQSQPPQQTPPIEETSHPLNATVPSPDAQLLWILAGQQEDAFVQYLTNYPSPETQRLLQNPAELQQTIEYLHQMMPSGQPPTINGIRHTDINSSNVWGTAYNAQTGQMKIRFQNGSEYEYDGIPPNIYNALTRGAATAKTTGSNQYGAWWEGKNPSIGAALNQYIKAMNFPYRRVR